MKSMFEGRTAEGVANQLAVVLMHAAECQFATLEGLTKRTSKHERERHVAICKTLVEQLVDLRVDPKTSGLRGVSCPRVREAMLRRIAGEPIIQLKIKEDKSEVAHG